VPARQHHRARATGLALQLLVLAGAATAQPAEQQPPNTTEPPTATPATPPAPTPAEIAESARTTVRNTTIWLARGVDSWFGDRPFEDGGSVSNGQLEVGLLKRESNGLDGDIRLNARFRLPNIDRLGYLFVGRDNEREVITDRPGALTRQDQLQASTAQDKKFFFGLGKALNDVFDVRLGLRGAFKPYVQARARGQWQLSERNRLEARQTFFWTVDDRAGSTTAVSFEHALNPTLALRWLSAATITQELPKFVWGSSVGAYHAFGDQRQLSLEALVNGQQGSGVGALDYGLQARWEQPLHEDWLLGGIVVGHFWPRPLPQAPRSGSWALGLNVRLRF
jgi:hypothetical protein